MLHPVCFLIQIQELKWIWIAIFSSISTYISKSQPSVSILTQELNLNWNLCLTLTQILLVLSVIKVFSLFLFAVLHGLGLESEHCLIENQNGTVTLIPLNDSQCSVNGVQITEPCPLNQGHINTFLQKWHLFYWISNMKFKFKYFIVIVYTTQFLLWQPRGA